MKDGAVVNSGHILGQPGVKEENTMGCNTFGNVAAYQLAHFRIVCRIPNVGNLCEPRQTVRRAGDFPRITGWTVRMRRQRRRLGSLNMGDE